MKEDPCPTHGECACGQPLCSECGGDSEPFECFGNDWWHCGECVATCPACQDALDGVV